MANFPNLGNPLNGFKETNVNTTIKAEFSGNYTQTRRTSTRTRKKFTASYLLDSADYATLEIFFNTYAGSSFTFIHPTKATNHNCIFSDSSLEAVYKTDELISVSINLEEL